MGLVWLEFPLHDDALVEQVCKPGHDDRVEHVNFEEEAVADVESIEWNAFGESDAGDIFGFVTIGVLPVTYSQSMVDGEVKPVNIGTN